MERHSLSILASEILCRLSRSASRLLLSIWLVLGLLAPQLARADVQYVYDENGRLTGVIDPTGNAAQYNYDAAGNITSITRTTSGTVSILEFTPNAGPIGTVVTIWGTGFSATPASNTVRFNGTAATVTSAAVNKLVVTVPAGATSGTISVTSPSGSATSTQSFTITTIGSGAPTITGFTPTIGLVGAAVTINGTNFQPQPTSNQVYFNVAAGAATTSSATQIQTSVPTPATSGPISVATPYGSATSAADFFVVPSGKSVTDIGYTGRIVPDGADLVATLNTANKMGLVVFSATRGQTLRLIVSPLTFSSVTVSVYSPWGTLIATNVVFSAGDTLLLNAVPTTGTYTIRLDPGAATGSATLSLKTAVPLPLDGSTVAVNLTRSGENGVFSFTTTTADQWIGVGISSLSFTPAGGTLNASIYNSAGALVSNVSPFGCGSYYAPGGRCGARNLPAGTYTLLIDPAGIATASMTLTASSDITGALTPNGTAQTFTTARVGQQAHYSFNVTNIAQHFTFLTTAVTGFTTLTLNLIKPDGTSWYGQGINATDGTMDVSGFPVTGTYTVYVVPAGTATGSITIALKQDDANTIAVDGSSLAINLAAGQNGRYTFTATAGQWIGVGISGLSFTPAGGTLTASIYNSVGTLLVNNTNLYAPNRLVMRNLPAGTYTLVIDPAGPVAASMTLTASSDITGALTPNSTALTFTTARVGQQAHYSFNVTNIAQHFTFLTTAVTGFTTLTLNLIKPDGTLWYGQGINATDGTMDVSGFPVTGTYNVYVVPSGAQTGSITIALKQDDANSIAVDGSSLAINLAAGQNGRYTFTATAGQWIGVGISGLSFTPAGGALTASIYNSVGTLLVNNTNLYAPNRLVMRNLAADTYTLVIDPALTVAASMTLTASSDITGALTSNGPAQIFTTARVGQQAHYSFNVTDITQHFTFLTTAVTGFTTLTLNLIKPDGTLWYGQGINATDGTMDVSGFPVTGTYNVYVVPSGAQTGSITIALKQDDANTIAVDGSSLAINLAAGQNGRYTFTATAGQWIGVGISSLSFTPAGGSVNASIYNSVGTLVTSNCVSYSAPGGRCTALNLPAGTYTLVIDPASTAAASMTLTVSSDITGALTPNGAGQTFTTIRVGQQAHYNFTATAGQSYKVVWSGSTFPAGSTIYVLKSDLTQLISIGFNNTTSSSGTLNLGTLGTGGTYYVYVVPYQTSTGQVTVSVTNP
jgi:YD repeat-containing protein